MKPGYTFPFFAALLFCSDHSGVKQSCFSGNCQSGDGMMIWYTMVYKGQFRSGRMHGKGSMNWSEGKLYKGDWVDGQMHGQGILEWSDGRRYEGSFEKGKRHGRGSLRAGDRTYEGEWANDKMHGRGRLEFSNGQVLDGYFEADVFKGTSP